MAKVQFPAAYPARFEPDGKGLIVTFRDVPEAITAGRNDEDARIQALDCLATALGGYSLEGRVFPRATKARRGEVEIPVDAETSIKAGLRMALAENDLTPFALARALGVDEKIGRRLVDPGYRSRLDRLEAALHAVGKRLVVTIEDGGEVKARRVPRGRPARAEAEPVAITLAAAKRA